MKHCIGCDRIKNDIEFAWQNKRLKKLRPRCIPCSKFKEEKYIDEIFNKIIAYLITHPCVDCGNMDVRVLEFDHLLNKKFNISEMVGNKSWEIIADEIVKCEVRCANCHRIVTHERANTKKQKWHIDNLNFNQV